VSLLNVPAAQSEQRRSDIMEPGASTCCPVVHMVQGAQDSAFLLALKVPVAHAAQTRSVMAVLWLTTLWPRPHSLAGTHGLAGLLS
jgi:hypothetical protein